METQVEFIINVLDNLSYRLSNIDDTLVALKTLKTVDAIKCDNALTNIARLRDDVSDMLNIERSKLV